MALQCGQAEDGMFRREWRDCRVLRGRSNTNLGGLLKVGTAGVQTAGVQNSRVGERKVA